MEMIAIRKHFLKRYRTFIFILGSILFVVSFINIYNKKKINITPIIIKDTVVKVEIEKIIIESDKDGDGLLDLDDIVEGARKDALNKPKYKSAYYQGGYPPDNEGVCTDVIWRAFENAGYDLKSMIDQDIAENLEDYPRVNRQPDQNIDFRRVQNLHVFFKKYATSLTLELKPTNLVNLKEWQGGDIVIFKRPEHIGIISDKRRNDGVPYLIHNAGPYTREANDLMAWRTEIIGHYRFPSK